MGWPTVARIWWPMWLQNREEVIGRILAEVDRAEAALEGGGAEPIPAAQPDSRGGIGASSRGAESRDESLISTATSSTRSFDTGAEVVPSPAEVLRLNPPLSLRTQRSRSGRSQRLPVRRNQRPRLGPSTPVSEISGRPAEATEQRTVLG